MLNLRVNDLLGMSVKIHPLSFLKLYMLGWFIENIHKLNNIVCISIKKLDSNYMVC